MEQLDFETSTGGRDALPDQRGLALSGLNIFQFGTLSAEEERSQEPFQLIAPG
jgi:hypothetical protein